MTATHLTVQQVAEREGVSKATVAHWIRSGELAAVNVSRNPMSKKPRFKIAPESLAAFEAARTATTPIPRVRRTKQSAEVIQFYR